MIDYIHFEAVGQACKDHLKPTVKISITDMQSHREGTVVEYRFGPLKVKQRKESFEVSGSLHHFFNWAKNGEFDNNHSQFAWSECCIAIDTLCSALNISPEEVNLRGYEYGYNLHTSFPPKDILENNLIGLRIGRTKSIERNHDEKGHFIGYRKDNYILKLYDKGKQKGLPQNIFRIEIKVRKQRHHPTVKTLACLKDLDNWSMFKKKLVDILLTELVIIDKPENWPSESNPKYWCNLKNRMERKRVFDSLPRSIIKEELVAVINSTAKALLPQLARPSMN